MDLHALFTFLKENGIIANIILVRLVVYFIIVLLAATIFKAQKGSRFVPVTRFFASVVINTIMSYVVVEFLPIPSKIWLLPPVFIGFTIDVLPDMVINVFNNPKTIILIWKVAFIFLSDKLKSLSDALKSVDKEAKGRLEEDLFGRTSNKEVDNKKETTEEPETKKEVDATDEITEMEERLKRGHRFKRH